MKKKLFRIILATGLAAALIFGGSLFLVTKGRLASLNSVKAGGDEACETNPVSERLLQHVYGSHSPIYPRAGEEVTYTASARGKEATGVGISSISIEVIQYELGEGNAVPLPLAEVNTFTEDQAFPDQPMEAQLTLTAGPYPEDTYVKYKATAVLADGTVLSDTGIRHAANLSEQTIVVFNGAVPVYRRGYHKDKFDFLFIPDADYEGDEDAYLYDVEASVYEGMFTDPPYRYKRFRRYMNIYVNLLRPAYTGDADSFSADVRLVDKPDNFDGEADPTPDLTWVDVAVVRHQAPFQDWGSRGFMEGKFCTADSSNVINMESLHALMDLYDEYGLKRPFTPGMGGEHPNLFETEQDCEDHVAEHGGFAVGHCEQVSEDTDNNDPGSDFNWHWCSEYNAGIGIFTHVMDSNGSGPFGVEERCRVAWAVDAILGDPAGSAYSPLWVIGCPGFSCAPPAAAAAAVPSSASASMRIPEEDVLPEDCRSAFCERQLWVEEAMAKSLVISLRLKNAQALLRAAAIHRGPPPNLGTAVIFKGREKEAPFRVQLLKGTLLAKEYGLSDPRQIGAELGKAKPELLTETTWDIRLPWQVVDVNRLRILDRSGRVWLDTSLQLAP
ncbi:MAG TPA: hypothetical protein VJ810_35480 [Blastocatellia bacterium]|nr:hypothetical protein [Blastocatellia bacterium]